MADINCFENLMKPENIKAFFGDNPPPTEALRAMADDLEALRKIHADDLPTYRSKLNAYVKDAEYQAKVRAITQATDLRKARDFKTYMNQTMNYENPREAIKAMLSGNTNILAIGGRDSVFARNSAVHQQAMTKIKFGLADAKITEIAASGAIDSEAKQVAEALHMGKPVPNVSPEAKAYGKVIHDVYKFMLAEARNADIPVRDLLGFSGPIMENHDTLHRTPFEEWAKDVRASGVNAEKTFGVHAGDVDKENKILQAIFNGKKMGYGAPDSNIASTLSENREGLSYTRKLTESRLLRFTDAAAEAKYLEKYGKGTMYEAMENDISRKSRMIGMVSKLGSNPEENFSKMIKQLEKQYIKDNRPDLVTKLQKAEREIKNLVEVATNRSSIPGLDTRSQIVEGILFINAMSKLLWSGLGSLPNLAVTASTLRSYTGSGFMENIQRIGLDWLKGFPAEARAKFAREAGFAFSDAMTSAPGQGGVMFGGLSRGFSYLSNNFMKLNGMDFVNSMQYHFARYFMSDVAEASTKSWEDIHPQMKTGLMMQNITEKDFPFLQHAIEKMPDGRAMVTPEAIGKLDPAMVRSRAAEMGLSAKAYINDLKMRYYGALVHGMTDSTTSSTWRERAATAQGYSKGTYQRALLDLGTQFKQFLVQANNIGSKIANSTADQAALAEGKLQNSGSYNKADSAKLIAGATVMGALSLIMIREAKKGSAYAFDETNKAFHDAMGWSPPEPVVQPGHTSVDISSREFWLDAMNKGGAGGFYMDALLGSHDKFNFLEGVAGPTFGQVPTLMATTAMGLKMLTGEAPRKSDGSLKDTTQMVSNMGRLVKSNVPFGQFPLFEQALNYGYYNILKESMSPGYVYRRYRREQNDEQRKQRGSK